MNPMYASVYEKKKRRKVIRLHLHCAHFITCQPNGISFMDLNANTKMCILFCFHLFRVFYMRSTSFFIYHLSLSLFLPFVGLFIPHPSVNIHWIRNWMTHSFIYICEMHRAISFELLVNFVLTITISVICIFKLLQYLSTFASICAHKHTHTHTWHHNTLKMMMVTVTPY